MVDNQIKIDAGDVDCAITHHSDGHRETLINGVLHWKTDGVDWTPFTAAELSRRVSVCEVAMVAKNKRLSTYEEQVGELQAVLLATHKG